MTSPRMSGFLLSTLVHGAIAAAIFVNFSGGKPAVEVGEQKIAPITLTMFQPPAPTPPPVTPVVEKVVEKPKPTPKKIVKKKKRPKKKKVVKKPPVKQQVAKPTPPPAKPVAKTPPTAAPTPQVVAKAAAPAIDPGILATLEQRYKAMVRKKIEAKKFYPRRAKRMRKEGEVTVRFTVLRDGSISNLSIIESSGIAILDKAARQAIVKVGSFQPFPEKITRNHWEFSIPLTYNLL